MDVRSTGEPQRRYEWPFLHTVPVTTKISRKSTLNFNKEIVVGEIGALIGAPLLSFIVSRVTSHPRDVSIAAVLGAAIGACSSWLAMRIRDRGKERNFSARTLAHDIAYFTPAALLLTVTVYYPTLYVLSGDLLHVEHRVVSSVIISQLAAFLLFLLLINVYRYLLAKIVGKVL